MLDLFQKFIQTIILCPFEKNIVAILYIAPFIACFYIFILYYARAINTPASSASEYADHTSAAFIRPRMMSSYVYSELEFQVRGFVDWIFQVYFTVLLLVFFSLGISRGLFSTVGLNFWVDSTYSARHYTMWLVSLPSEWASATSALLYRLDPGFDVFSQVSISAVSIWLVTLTFFIIFYSYSYVKSASENQARRYELYMCLLFLLSGISFVFLTDNLLLFYVGFESTLIPMFYMILRFGSRSRKSLAANYIFLYTVAGSLLFLIVISILYLTYGELNIYTLSYRIANDAEFLNSSLYKICAVLTFIAFSVKVPMLPFHIWLPEAHVEAPTVGSVVLAGLLLKLGGFGFIKFFILLFSSFTYTFTSVFLMLFILSSVYSSFVVLTQDDAKKAIAYASISHMNGAMLGLFSLTKVGKCATIFYMIGHGFISSALFFLIGMLYSRLGTRDLKNFGGIASRMPLYANLSLFMWLANMGFPGTVNFLSEFLIIIGLVQVNVFLVILLFLSLVISAVYSIWLFSKINFGSINSSIRNFYDLTYFEFTVVGSLLVFTLVLGVIPGLIINSCVLDSFIFI